MSRRPVGDRLVVSPMEALVAGGAAETFERQLQQLYRGGYRHPVVDFERSVRPVELTGLTGEAEQMLVDRRAELDDARRAVFARNQIVFEPREISQSDDVTVKYFTWLDARTSLEDLSGRLMSNGAGVKSVAWEHPKRERP
jgi:hypothetical protein